jgi:hypothetical protein
VSCETSSGRKVLDESRKDAVEQLEGVLFPQTGALAAWTIESEYRWKKPSNPHFFTKQRNNDFGSKDGEVVTKSGNSLVIRIPPEIAEFLGIHY